MARAKLSGALLAQKGAASPHFDHRDEARRSAPLVGEGSRPIALTLKVDQARYEASRCWGAHTAKQPRNIAHRARCLPAWGRGGVASFCGSVALTCVGWSYVPVAGDHAGRPNSLLTKLTSPATPASRSRQ